jgi:hypothetical protein
MPTHSSSNKVFVHRGNYVRAKFKCSNSGNGERSQRYDDDRSCYFWLRDNFHCCNHIFDATAIGIWLAVNRNSLGFTMRQPNKTLLALIVILLLAACRPLPNHSSAQLPQEIHDAEIFGMPYIEPTIERVRTVNCDGQNNKINFGRSLSQGQTTFFEVEIGAGGLVKGALIPHVLQAELEAKIQAAIGRALTTNYQQHVSLEIETAPGTAYEHIVTWHETKVRGAIGVVYPTGIARVGFEKTIGVELYGRESEPLNCELLSGSSLLIAPQDETEHSPIFTPESVAAENTVPASIISCQEFGGSPIQIGDIAPERVNQWRNIGHTTRNHTAIIIYCEIHQVSGYVSFSEGDTIPPNVIITADLGFNWRTQYSDSIERLVHEGGGWGVFLSLKSFTVQPASDLNYPVGGQYWYVTGSNVSATQSTNTLSQSQLDALFGSGNWFCFPDRENGVGVKRLAANFTVRSPLRYIDNWMGRFQLGATVPQETGATAELDSQLPKAQCPSFQQEALTVWLSKRSSDLQPFSRTRFDAILGAGNWQCLPDYTFGIKINHLSSPMTVEYPFAVIDVEDGTRYGVGEIAPGNGRATIWLGGSIPQEQCP